jgi:hypothetical protein
MNNYGNEYGAKNVAGGVEFYFELDLKWFSISESLYIAVDMKSKISATAFFIV